MENSNAQWVINCINSCTNLEQLKVCEILIGLFKFRLLKDGLPEKDIYDLESKLLENYLNKESVLEV